jgi:translocation and assembly module TamB
MKDSKVKKGLFKGIRILSWILLSLIGLLLLITIAIQIPFVQNKIKQQAISFLEEKIGTRVELERFSLSFPKKIVLSGLYMEDQEKDTLLYAGYVGIDTDLWALLDNSIELNKIELDNITASIKRSDQDSAFNFDYILKAFATPDSIPADTTAVVWDFVLGDVDLKNLRFSLSDHLSGNHAQITLRQFGINTEHFDLKQSDILFDDINVIGLKADVEQTKPPLTIADSVEVIPEDSSAIAFNVGFRSINVRDVEANYSHRTEGQVIHLKLPEGVVEANVIDVKKQVLDLSRIILRNAFVSYQQLQTPERAVAADPVVVQQKQTQDPWSIAVGSVDLAGSNLQYFNFNEPAQPQALDFNRLSVTDLNTRIRNVRYDGAEAYADIAQFSFREKSGFRLRNFRASVALLDDSAAVKGLRVVTGNSDLSADAAATFPSLAALGTNPETAKVTLEVRSSIIGLRDVLYFNPGIADSLAFSLPTDGKLRLDAMIHGSMQHMDIRRFQFHALGNTSLFASGTVKNIADPDGLYLSLQVDRFYTTRNDLYALLPDTIFPPAIEVPQWVSLTASYKGSLKTPDVKGTITSDMGAVEMDARMNLTETVKENYRGEVRFHDFFLGKLLKQPDQIGRIDMVATVNGAGLSIDDLDALFKVRVNRFDYSGYTYRDFRLDGTMKKYFFSGKASLSDENLDFVLTGDLDYNEDVPHYALDLDLKNADFKKLKLTPTPLKARAKLEVDLYTTDFQRINGDLGIRKFALFNGEALYAVDSLLFASIDQEGQSEISVRSDIVTGDFKGTINIFQLPDVLTRHFNKYFSLRDTTYTKPLEEQNFKFDLVLKNTDLLTEILFPELEPFVPGKITGEFNSATDDLKLHIGVSDIKYSALSLDSVSVKVQSDENSFDYTVSLKNILIDTVNIKTLRLAGNVLNDSIRTNLMILDSLDQEKYFLGGVFHSFEDAFQFSFLQNQITLNYEEWNTPRYNTLTFADTGLEPNNFWISKGNERILLLKKNNADSALSIVFNEVNLRNITSIVEGTNPVSGVIDGELTLSSSRQSSFETDLRIRDLGLFERTWGDLALLVNKKGNAPMNFRMTLDGADAEMRADGFLSGGDDPVVMVRAQVSRLNLAIVQPLTMGQLRDMSGQLTAQLTVQGRTASPDLSGMINFRDAAFHSTYANSSFSLENETIYLRGDDFVFDRFNVLDNRKNKATLDGLITSTKQAGYKLRLNLTAANFQLLNTTEDDNELFYGNIRLNTSAAITGTSLAPIVRMNISLSEGSELTYIVPQSEKGILEQKGIVVFIDKDAENDPFMKSINPQDTVQVGFTGVDLTANIELSDTEKFNIVLDPVTGDRLSVAGNSTLSLHMDPTGDMQLSGRYEISSGTYDLSFAKFVKRNFVIEKGSNITWSGDPMNAEMDIRAIYEVETAPIELVVNQVPEEELPTYKKRLPFQVYLILKGELLFPEISFELDMPEEDRNEFGGTVYAKLKDINTRESDLNKQVFALLILKRFISDNPFENQAGGSLASTARQSVSKILSEQLNRLSSNVKGVELSFDLKSYDDYSTGRAANQTELELGMSKSLMNDRLVVKVSGNVDIEGENSRQNSFTDFIGDLALEYKLTEDGRFRITGFRNSDYDMINGDLIETGAGLIYIKDYDSLNELFKPNARK